MPRQYSLLENVSRKRLKFDKNRYCTLDGFSHEGQKINDETMAFLDGNLNLQRDLAKERSPPPPLPEGGGKG